MHVMPAWRASFKAESPLFTSAVIHGMITAELETSSDFNASGASFACSRGNVCTRAERNLGGVLQELSRTRSRDVGHAANLALTREKRIVVEMRLRSRWMALISSTGKVSIVSGRSRTGNGCLSTAARMLVAFIASLPAWQHCERHRVYRVAEKQPGARPTDLRCHQLRGTTDAMIFGRHNERMGVDEERLDCTLHRCGSILFRCRRS